jgi:molybdopterin synthase catalytic subunit
VAGGDPDRRRWIELTPDPIGPDLLAELRAAVSTDRDGAVVLFVGQTREDPGTPAPGQEADAARFEGQSVERLEYEAFDELALAVLGEIADEIEGRFGVARLAIVHRTGVVPLGEPSVVIAVAAPHRGAAFDGCRYAIEELNARAPIWKSEQFADGSVWIGSPARTGPTDGGGQ